LRHRYHRDPFPHVRVFPLKGLGSFLIEADVAEDLAFEVGDGSEDAPIDDVALELTEPALDLVEPSRIGWREVQCHVGMLLKVVLHQVGLVSGEVVQDDMHLTLGALRRYNVLQEGDKLLAGVACRGLSDDLSSCGLSAAYSDSVP
jgi:hypothetical protein